MSESCGQCRYYRADIDLAGPPTIDMAMMTVKLKVGSQHPCFRHPKAERKEPNEWCGEFKKKEL